MRYINTLLILLLTGCHTGFHEGPVTDHFDGKHFYYPGEPNKNKKTCSDLFNLWVAIMQNPWPSKLPTIKYPIIQTHPDTLRVTFINHSTVLIEGKSVNALLDPIYSYRASPFQWIGPSRKTEPGIKLKNLPKIDVVLISHNHYDHMDIATLKYLNKVFHPVFVVPLGNKNFLQRYGIDHVIELDWWENTKVKHTTVTFLPAHHSTQRWLHDYNRTLWGSYGIELDGRKVYFAGDTAYADHFKTIRQKWGKPDLSLIPIGAYVPRYLLKSDHINPKEAVKSHLDLGSDVSIGIHWGTFQLSAESMDQPSKDLSKARSFYQVREDAFFVTSLGKPYYLPLDTNK